MIFKLDFQETKLWFSNCKFPSILGLTFQLLNPSRKPSKYNFLSKKWNFWKFSKIAKIWLYLSIYIPWQQEGLSFGVKFPTLIRGMCPYDKKILATAWELLWVWKYQFILSFLMNQPQSTFIYKNRFFQGLLAPPLHE